LFLKLLSFGHSFEVRKFSCLLATFFFCGGVLAANGPHTQVKLLLESNPAAAGQELLVGVQLKMDSGWHTYWRNSGGSGSPTTIKWTLPAGVTVGETLWPVPEKIPETNNFTTYVYTNEVILLVPLKISSQAVPGPLKLGAKVDWLECAEQCVPGSAEVESTLTIAAESKPSKDSELLDAWKKRLPKPLGTMAAQASWAGPANGEQRTLMLEWNANPKTAYDFYPDSSEVFETIGDPQKLSAPSGKFRQSLAIKKLSTTWPTNISGIVVEPGTHSLGYEIKTSIENGPSVSTAQAAMAHDHSLLTTLLYAFLGGLILNIMPCVLPVIALKILGFVSQAHDDPREVRKLGLIYTLGVLSSFFVLALLVIGLKAAGGRAGWGFQFGNPYFLVAMTILVTLVALNLFGVFEVYLGSGTLTAATELSSRHGAAGAFFNGLLATILATSCSAPFLGAAIGFAFSEPPIIIVLVMLMVGVGLSFPYLVLAWNPKWLKFLPKPGVWMEKFKIAMGFPMIAAALWLANLLTIHYGEKAWWMNVFLIFLAVAVWIYGEFVQRGTSRRGLGVLFALVVLFAGYAYALENQLRWRHPLQGETSTSVASFTPEGVPWQPWSPEAVVEGLSQGRPVLVDFTAKWCPTCNTIVKPSLESAAVQKKMKEVNALALLADYSRYSTNIGAELSRWGRAGVPLVLIYPAKSNAPPMIFDLVTPSTLLKALEQAR
jgi:thiol:disulfide interchange protein DsbD